MPSRTFVLWQILPMMRSLLPSPHLVPLCNPPPPTPSPTTIPCYDSQHRSCSWQQCLYILYPALPLILHSVQSKHAMTLSVINTPMTADCSASTVSECSHCICRYHQPVTVEEVIKIFDKSCKSGSTTETSDKDLAVLNEVRTHPFALAQSVCHSS